MARSGLTTNYVPAYSGNYTQGRSRYGKIERITIHHSAGTDLLGKLWQTVGRRGSSNYAIKNNIIENYVDESDIAWCDGSWSSNKITVSIETVNSSVGGDWLVADDTLATLIKLMADIARRNNLGTLARGKNIFSHKEVSLKPTACPGPYLSSKLDYIVAEANKLLGAAAVPVETSKPNSVSNGNEKYVIYQRGSKGKWVDELSKFMRKAFPIYTNKKALGPVFGPYLEASIKEFQRRSNLGVDGRIKVPGGETYKELKKYGFGG